MEQTNTGRPGDPLIGRVLNDRYRVDSRIARGGMATVYSGTDLRLDRTVAIKVLNDELTEDADFVRRFEREARSAARLSHHNLVAIYDQGDDDGLRYLVMEHIIGRTLRDVIREEAPVTPGRAFEMLEPVLAALAAAHRAGMVHRDVKPENVLIATDGRVKVTDFGLTRPINSDTQHTAAGGVLIGTVSYLAPELVVDTKPDARADVYAWGVILFEMLTGEKPHQAENPIQVAYKHVHEDVPPPSSVVPTVPDYVDALVARATARDRDQRPTDAGVLQQQLHRVRLTFAQGIRSDSDLAEDLRPSGRIATRTSELPGLAEIEDLFTDDSPTGTDEEAVVLLGSPNPTASTAPAGSSGGVTEGEHTAVVEPLAPLIDPTPTPERGHSPMAGSAAYDASPPRVAADVTPGPPPQRRRSRRGLVLLILVLILAAGSGVGAWYYGVARYTVTPGVVNLPEEAARTKVTDAGLGFTVADSIFSETVAKGSVISTEPTAGAKILKNGRIKAVLSLGPERYAVPKVRKMTQAQATQKLRAASLDVGEVAQEYNENIDADLVIRSNPTRGTMLKRETPVKLVISRGPKPISIPDWTGRSAAKATERFRALEFTVGASEAFSDTVRKGRIISQTPNSGTGFKGDRIAIVVSKGPQLIAVPSVRGKSVDDATAQLEALGFTVKVEKTRFYVGAGIVVSSDPEAGRSVPRGSTITLGTV